MKTIFENVDLGGLNIKNRILRSATQEGSADENGNMTPALLAIYETLAAGGVGAIITAMIGVDENARVFSKMLKAYGDDFVPGFSRLATLVHQHDCKVIVQLAHCGAKARPDSGNNPLAPSDFPINLEKPARAMTQEEIHGVVSAFAQAAVRCKEAGADGVQIHGAHGYLLNQFLSPVFNQRTDEYGGNIENRARVVFEVYNAVREAVGEDYPIFVKINSEDLVDGGFSLEECIWICGQLDKLGINGIEVSGGLSVSGKSASAQRVQETDTEGNFERSALDIAEKISAPVISVCGYRSPDAIESALNRGKIEAISMCRPLISEPDLPNRWKAGSKQRARCISCNKCFNYQSEFGCKAF